jgi:hypothetical protein
MPRIESFRLALRQLGFIEGQTRQSSFCYLRVPTTLVEQTHFAAARFGRKWHVASFRGNAAIWFATTDDRMPRQIEFGHEHAGDESCLFGCLRPVIKIGFEFCRRLLFHIFYSADFRF